jgi:hypothetical protein
MKYTQQNDLTTIFGSTDSCKITGELDYMLKILKEEHEHTQNTNYVYHINNLNHINKRQTKLENLQCVTMYNIYNSYYISDKKFQKDVKNYINQRLDDEGRFIFRYN